jgi:PPK2 family polyphosphate:nucleotide phosphotransferase
MPRYKLNEISTRAPKEFNKQETKEQIEGIKKEMNELQNVLYAQGEHALLVILQGMDASGKDGVIRNVFASINPQGVSVKSFKAPTSEELAHDFLWRVHSHTPAKGMIEIFNRSHYEDILITRVHKLCDDKLARERMKAINHFEELLQVHNQTHILKFYLHISKEEQQERIAERLKDPTKHWKYDENDLNESKLWDDYMKMYEDCFENCNEVPWTIVPADQNWYKEFIVASAVRDLLKGLRLEYPQLKKD